MNIYTAIMKAADQVERHPEEFKFSTTEKPGCGPPGCAIGWIGFMLGIEDKPGFCYITPVCKELGVSDYRFYCRLDKLTGFTIGPPPMSEKVLARRWTRNASECARGLRLYAEKYHGHEKPAERNFAQEMEAVMAGAKIAEAGP